MKELPKALSVEERHDLLSGCRSCAVDGPRALALIDALTEALSEAVARMTVAEAEVAGFDTTGDAATIAELEARLSETRTSLDQVFNEKVGLEQASLLYVNRINAAESERDAANARAEAVEQQLEILRDEGDEARQERNEALARAEAAERDRRLDSEHASRLLESAVAQCDAALARAEAAEKDAERWRYASQTETEARAQRAESEAAVLHAENERLRTEALMAR